MLQRTIKDVLLIAIVVMVIVIICLAPAHSQNSKDSGALFWGAGTNGVASGTAQSFIDVASTLTNQFEVVASGTAASTLTGVVVGCMPGGTCSSTLASTSGVGSQILSPSSAGPFMTYKMTLTWTGGDATTAFKVNRLGVIGRITAPGANGLSGMSGGQLAVAGGPNSITSSVARPAGAIVGTTDVQVIDHKDLTAGTNTFPTFNQNTTGTAGGLTGTPSISISGLIVGGVSAFNNNATFNNPATFASDISLKRYGPSIAPVCVVDTTLDACVAFLKVTLGLQGGIIYDNLPEFWTTNPFRQGFAGEVHMGTGLNSTTCEVTGGSPVANGWVAQVPIIIPSGVTLHATGRVGFGNNQSSGTAICSGSTFPAPLGKPTEGAATCNPTGGFLGNGNYFVQVATANNLQTAASSANPIVGISFPTNEATVNCNGGGSNQSISVPSPSAVGSGSFIAKDYYVYASTTSGLEFMQPVGTNLFTCGTPGILDTTTCLMGSTAVIQTIQTHATTGGFPPQLFDTTNALFVEGGQFSQGAVFFSTDVRDLTLQAFNQGVNSPNVVFLADGQENTGFRGLNINGVCGGYSLATVGPGAAVYSTNLSLNSRFTGGQIGCTTTSGTIYSMVLDGRDGPGPAQGYPRYISDTTLVSRLGGALVPAQLWINGADSGNGGAIDISALHTESPVGGDGILIDNGARANIHGSANGVNGYTIHVTSTGGGVSAQGIGSNQGKAIKDDLCNRTLDAKWVNTYDSPCVGSSDYIYAGATKVATDFTTAANTALQTITGLSVAICADSLCPATKYSFHCSLTYSQATAAVAVAFGVQAATTAPTAINANGQQGTSLTAFTTGTLRGLATTTATNIVSVAPSVAGAIGTAADMFNVILEGTVENPANSPNTINWLVSTSNSADLVTVYRGSYCQVF